VRIAPTVSVLFHLHWQNSDHASLCAKTTRLVLVVNLSSSDKIIGLIHSQPATGAAIFTHPAVELSITKASNACLNFRPALCPRLCLLQAGQACGLFTRSAQAPVTEQACQGIEEAADDSDRRQPTHLASLTNMAMAAATAAMAVPTICHCSAETPKTMAKPASPAQVLGSLARSNAQYAMFILISYSDRGLAAGRYGPTADRRE